jgi:flavin-dependent dehydrogenase
MYDAIVIGARCAGSPCAMLLAKQGHKVLLVDKATFPSDQLQSTLLIWPAGLVRLQRWGLLDSVIATGCPPIRRFGVFMGPLTFAGSPPTDEGIGDSLAPRRTVLDQILVNAAAAAGATVETGFSVETLLRDGDRITGIRGRTANGSVIEERAKIVVGAEGSNSLVAKAVAAPEYDTHDPIVFTYYTYYENVRLSTGFDFEYRPGSFEAVYAWPTNDNRLLLGVNIARDLSKNEPYGRVFEALRSDPDREFSRVVSTCAPAIAAQIQSGGTRAGALVGGYVRNFFRKPYGPGWALAGDAGSAYEFTTAHGITNAFRQAEWLAEAIGQGLGDKPMDEALAAFEKRRNDFEAPFYQFTLKQTTLQPPPEEALPVFAAIASDQQATDGFYGLYSQAVSPVKYFSPENIGAIMARSSRASS